MAPSRSTLLTQTHKVLKKHYQVVAPDPNRPVLEHVIRGFLLENAPYGTAEAVFTSLQENYFEWNEVRVATVSDLTEQLKRSPEPALTAASLCGALQSVFDTTFSFDLEHLRKENLGKAVEKLEKFKGSRPFMVSYVVQAALGGHAIPLDRGALEAFTILGAITPAEKQAGTVPGLERAIPKNKGIEFASLLHQLSADFVANPFSPSVHKTLLEINPSAKDRLPKRGKKGAEEAPAEPAKASAGAAKPRASRPAKPKQPAAKKTLAESSRRKPR
jgi:endonuclease-3